MTPSTKQFQSEKRPFSLGIVWQEQMSNRHGWQKNLTRQECGQLKMLANSLGPRTREVMSWAMENWSDFAYRASLADGVASFPAEPHIGFLLAHCDVAGRRMQAMAEEKKRNEDRITERLKEEAERAANATEKKAALDAENAESIAEMEARFAAAGETAPEPTFNNAGEVTYRPTKKELAEIMAS
jgi:hypothetical protein